MRFMCAVLLSFVSFFSCKKSSESDTKNLEHLASDSAADEVACGTPGNQSSYQKFLSQVVDSNENKATYITAKDARQIELIEKAKTTLSVLPPELLAIFFVSARGRIEINSSRARELFKDALAPAEENRKVGTLPIRNVTNGLSAWVVVLPAVDNTIATNLVRLVMSVIDEFMTNTVIDEAQNFMSPGNNGVWRNDRDNLVVGFFFDAKQHYDLKGFKDPNLRAVFDKSIDEATTRTRWMNFVLQNPPLAETVRRVVVSHAFDSYLCSTQTAARAQAKFPRAMGVVARHLGVFVPSNTLGLTADFPRMGASQGYSLGIFSTILGIFGKAALGGIFSRVKSGGSGGGGILSSILGGASASGSSILGGGGLGSILGSITGSGGLLNSLSGNGGAVNPAAPQGSADASNSIWGSPQSSVPFSNFNTSAFQLPTDPCSVHTSVKVEVGKVTADGLCEVNGNVYKI